jgi:hypothetical protein
MSLVTKGFIITGENTMKFVLTMVTFLSLTSNAFAAGSNGKIIVIRPGTYEAKHEIALMFVGDESECKDNDGVWNGELCVIKDGSDSIEVSVTKKKRVVVSIAAVGTNLHTCEFEGNATALPSGRLLAQAQTEVYDMNSDKAHKDTCKLIIDKKKDGLSSTVVKGKEDACATFCGVNMSLEIEGAK